MIEYNLQMKLTSRLFNSGPASQMVIQHLFNNVSPYRVQPPMGNENCQLKSNYGAVIIILFFKARGNNCLFFK